MENLETRLEKLKSLETGCEAVSIVLEILKENKIGKGCKIEKSSNKIFIKYPIHKTSKIYIKETDSYIDNQFKKDLEFLRSIGFRYQIETNVISNSGAINIWIVWID